MAVGCLLVFVWCFAVVLLVGFFYCLQDMLQMKDVFFSYLISADCSSVQLLYFNRSPAGFSIPFLSDNITLHEY